MSCNISPNINSNNFFTCNIKHTDTIELNRQKKIERSKNNKRVLYIPQWNMSDGKKLFIRNDGNYVVLEALIKYCDYYANKNKEKFSFFVLIPINSKSSVSLKEFETIDCNQLSADNVEIIGIPFNWDVS